MNTSVRAPSRFLYHTHYINSDLRCNFIIDRYGISPFLRLTISYTCNMYVYDLLLYVSSNFVSTLDFVFSPSVSMLDSIFSHSVSPLGLITYVFYPTLTKFVIRSLVQVGSIYRVSTCFHPMITSQNFANRAPSRSFLKKSKIMCSVLQYAIEFLLLSNLFLANK